LAEDSQTSLGLFETHSLNSLVTDSAAASSALNCGSRVFNCSINVLPNGEHLIPLGVLFKDIGKKLGVVTTSAVTHATPAGFMASFHDRNNEEEIARQVFKLSPEVIMGGAPTVKGDEQARAKRDFQEQFVKKNYLSLTQRDELLSCGVSGKPLLGLFGTGHFPYEIDRNINPLLAKRIPTLAEMTRQALDSLASAPDGFVLQVEGARIDQAAHANDAATLLWEQLAFDDAIGVALDFVRDHPETLVLITSDHATANPGLIGIGAGYDQSNAAFVKLAGVQCSFVAIRDQLELLGSSIRDLSVVQETIFKSTGLKIDKHEAALLVSSLLPESPNGLTASPPSPTILEVLATIMTRYTGIDWASTKHTSDHVPVLALGPGHGEFLGLMKNTDSFWKLASLTGITHRNRSMTPSEAAQFLSTEPSLLYVPTYN
jgi:alkaline phosphatase